MGVNGNNTENANGGGGANSVSSKIPADWLVKPLGNAVTFLDGRRRPVKDADRAKMKGDIPYYGASGVIDFVNDYLFDDDLILLGEDGENILSRNCRLAFRITGKAWVNNHAHVLKPHPDMAIGYLVEVLESFDYTQYNSGTAQPKLNKKTCHSLLIPVPPTLAEQEAISSTVSDVDSLINSLADLAVKKRQIKLGAMQGLLTGKQRVLGFAGGWSFLKLGDICRMRSGESITSAKINNHAKYPCYGGNGLRGYTARWTHDGLYVLIGRQGALCGNVLLVKNKFFASEHAIVAAANPNIDTRWLAFILERMNLNQYTESSAQPGLSVSKMLLLDCHVPAKHEQSAIADILSALNAEIITIEEKLTKARHLKQAMMQQLLTGKIRLI